MAASAAPQKSSREIEPITLKSAQRSIGPHADIAHHRDRIIPITKRGNEYAALIGIEDLKRLRKLDKKAAEVPRR